MKLMYFESLIKMSYIVCLEMCLHQNRGIVFNGTYILSVLWVWSGKSGDVQVTSSLFSPDFNEVRITLFFFFFLKYNNYKLENHFFSQGKTNFSVLDFIEGWLYFKYPVIFSAFYWPHSNCCSSFYFSTKKCLEFQWL